MGWREKFIGSLGKGNRGVRAHEAALRMVQAGGFEDIGQLSSLTNEQAIALAKKVRKKDGKSAISWLVLGWITNIVGRD